MSGVLPCIYTLHSIYNHGNIIPAGPEASNTKEGDVLD